MEERVQKLMAAAGLCSRRAAEEILRQGRVTVNGRVASLGDRADPDRDTVAVDGAALPGREEKVYLLLHKPRGYACTLSDPHAVRLVTELLTGCTARVYPVGRLDVNSEGLLLLTNDGALAHRLLSPKRHVDKVYYLEVDGVLDQADVEAVRAGVVLGDGYTCLPGELEPLGGGRGRIAIHEGKYHQVKRMMAARGKPVTYLERVRFGPLELDRALPRGAYRRLNDEELKGIFSQ